MHERITIDPHIGHGQAVIRGTRIPVHQIVRMLANGDTIEDLLEEYPSLTREDILAALDYVATLAEEEVSPIEASGVGCCFCPHPQPLSHAVGEGGRALRGADAFPLSRVAGEGAG